MHDVDVRSFGVSVQIVLGPPVVAQEAELPRRAKEILSALAVYGVKAKDVTLANGDGLFDYRLQFSLFAGAGSAVLTAEELHLEFKNARTAKNGEVILACLLACTEHLMPSKAQSLLARVDFHAAFPREQERDNFITGWLRSPPGFEAEGLIVRRQNIAPFDLVELRLERSAQVETGVYFSLRGVVNGFSEPELFVAAWHTTQEQAKCFDLNLVFGNDA